MYAKHKWANYNDVQIAQKRTTARNDSWILFMKNRITEEEYRTFMRMATSPDVENVILVIELIKAKNRKKKKHEN